MTPFRIEDATGSGSEVSEVCQESLQCEPAKVCDTIRIEDATGSGSEASEACQESLQCVESGKVI